MEIRTEKFAWTQLLRLVQLCAFVGATSLSMQCAKADVTFTFHDLTDVLSGDFNGSPAGTCTTLSSSLIIGGVDLGTGWEQCGVGLVPPGGFTIGDFTGIKTIGEGATGVLSDIVQVSSAANVVTLNFYSDPGAEPNHQCDAVTVGGCSFGETGAVQTAFDVTATNGSQTSTLHVNFESDPVPESSRVPEPSSLILLGSVLLGFFGLVRFARTDRLSAGIRLGLHFRPLS